MEPIIFQPQTRNYDLRLATDMPSAWGNIPSILNELISKFNIKTDSAIEFGVEFGYSIGVDHGNGYSYQTRTGFDFSGGK